MMEISHFSETYFLSPSRSIKTKYFVRRIAIFLGYEEGDSSEEETAEYFERASKEFESFKDFNLFIFSPLGAYTNGKKYSFLFSKLHQGNLFDEEIFFSDFGSYRSKKGDLIVTEQLPIIGDLIYFSSENDLSRRYKLLLERQVEIGDIYLKLAGCGECSKFKVFRSPWTCSMKGFVERCLCQLTEY
jgi:hypothetical protein